MNLKLVGRLKLCSQKCLLNIRGFTFLLILCAECLFAQVPSKFITKNVVITKAKKHGFKFDQEHQRQPIMMLDSIHKVWIVRSVHTKHVKKGPCSFHQPKSDTCNCRYTNGCTESKTRELRINALSGKLIRLKTESKRFPNYE